MLSLTIDLAQGGKWSRGHLSRYYQYINGVEANHRAKRLRVFFMGNRDSTNSYHFNARKYFLYALPVWLLVFLFSLFFFRSLTFALLFSLIGFFYPRIIIKSTINKRRLLLNKQLREAMYAINASLQAGSSLQGAIERCEPDLQRIFHREKDAPILIELKRINHDLRLGFSLEEALLSFKDRVRLEDVDDFVAAILIARTRGGNITEILTNISKVISEKIEIKNEIDILTSGKRMESRILSIMPLCIVFCITVLSPQYMEPLYDNLIGKLLMFCGFTMIVANFFISRKIVNIDI